MFRSAGTKSPKRTSTLLSASSTAFNTKIEALIAELNDAILCSDLRTLSETALLNATGTSEHLGRHVEALQFASAGELAARSHKSLGLSGLAATKGCGTAAELLERVTGISNRAASRRVKTGSVLKPALNLSVAALVAAATGSDLAGLVSSARPVKVTADELKILAQRHADYLNPDSDPGADLSDDRRANPYR